MRNYFRVLVFFSIFVVMSFAVWAQAPQLKNGEDVPIELVEKAAAYYAENSWSVSRIISSTPYYALDGSINAWAVMFAKSGSDCFSEQDLKHKMYMKPKEGSMDEFLDGKITTFLVDDVVTVIIAARSDLYPVLEAYSGLAPHLRYVEEIGKYSGASYKGSTINRTYFLGPLIYLMEPVNAEKKSDGNPGTLIDPIFGNIFDTKKKSKLSGKSGRLKSTSGLKRKITSEEVWTSFDKSGLPPKSMIKVKEVQKNGKVDETPPEHWIDDFPYYHQHLYGRNSCGPTAPVVALGYWDMHGYGNLIDNGWCLVDYGSYKEGGGHGVGNIGNVFEAVYRMMRCVDWDDTFGTWPWDIADGVEAFCTYDKYGNEINMNCIDMYYFNWSDIPNVLKGPYTIELSWFGT